MPLTPTTNRALIPNRAGHRVRICTRDGRVIDTEVERDPETGGHRLRGVAIVDVLTWVSL